MARSFVSRSALTQDDRSRRALAQDDRPRSARTQGDRLRSALTQDDRPRSALTQDDRRKQRANFSALMLVSSQVLHTGSLPCKKCHSERSEESDLMARSFVSRSALTQDDRSRRALAQDDRPRSALTQDDRSRRALTQDDRLRRVPTQDDGRKRRTNFSRLMRWPSRLSTLGSLP